MTVKATYLNNKLLWTNPELLPPSYVIDEVATTVAKVNTHNFTNMIRFIAVTDSHHAINENFSNTEVIFQANKHAGQAVDLIRDSINVDFVANLGDCTWRAVSEDVYNSLDEVKADISSFNSLISDGFSGVANIRVVGNHDQSLTPRTGGTRLFNTGAYPFFGAYNPQEHTVQYGGWGYYDIIAKKVRCIYLNTSDTDDSTAAGTFIGVSQSQKNWLAQTLIDTNSKSDANDWKILIFSHVPLDLIVTIANDILIPYVNGTSYNTYSFNNNVVPILGNVHGHVHCFNIGYMGDKIRRMAIPNSNFVDNNHYKNVSGYEAWVDSVTYAKTANTGKDTSLSVVTINLDNNMCYIDNYGAGIDREFSCDYYSPVVNQIPLSKEADGTTIYNNGLGYKDGYRLNSSGAETAYANGQITGFIPYTYGDSIGFDKFTGGLTATYCGIYFYDSNHTYKGGYRAKTMISDGVYTGGNILNITPTSPIHDAGTGGDRDITSSAYIRIVIDSQSGTLPLSNCVCTINQSL